MKTIATGLSVADMIAIARGWQSSGLDQVAYAARHGIKPCTLRSWVTKYAPSGMPAARAREIIERAIADLQALLAQLLEEGVPEQVPVQIGNGEKVDAGAASSMPAAVPPPVHRPHPQVCRRSSRLLGRA